MLTAVIFSHKNGYDHDREEIKALGEIGDQFPVEYVSMGQSRTSIKLKDHKNSFNSVNFIFLKNGAKHNIFDDPEYNPYI